MNRVKIYGEKCLGRVTLKVLLTSCFLCNSEGKNAKLLTPKMKLNRTDTSFPLQGLL